MHDRARVKIVCKLRQVSGWVARLRIRLVYGKRGG